MALIQAHVRGDTQYRMKTFRIPNAELAILQLFNLENREHKLTEVAIAASIGVSVAAALASLVERGILRQTSDAGKAAYMALIDKLDTFENMNHPEPVRPRERPKHRGWGSW